MRSVLPRADHTLHKFGARTLSGIFMGYATKQGEQRAGDYLILERDEFRNNPDHLHTHVQRMPEIIIPQRILFPIYTGHLILGADC